MPATYIPCGSATEAQPLRQSTSITSQCRVLRRGLVLRELCLQECQSHSLSVVEPCLEGSDGHCGAQDRMEMQAMQRGGQRHDRHHLPPPPPPHVARGPRPQAHFADSRPQSAAAQPPAAPNGLQHMVRQSPSALLLFHPLCQKAYTSQG